MKNSFRLGTWHGFISEYMYSRSEGVYKSTALKRNDFQWNCQHFWRASHFWCIDYFGPDKKVIFPTLAPCWAIIKSHRKKAQPKSTSWRRSIQCTNDCVINMNWYRKINLTIQLVKQIEGYWLFLLLFFNNLLTVVQLWFFSVTSIEVEAVKKKDFLIKNFFVHLFQCQSL